MSQRWYWTHFLDAKSILPSINLTFKNRFFDLRVLGALATNYIKNGFLNVRFVDHKNYLLPISAFKSMCVTPKESWMQLWAAENFLRSIYLTFKIHILRKFVARAPNTPSKKMDFWKSYMYHKKLSIAHKCVQHAVGVTYMLLNALIGSRLFLWVTKSDFQKSILT